jgi:hypothetical protein
MTLLFMDGFEGQDALQKWHVASVVPSYAQPTRYGDGVCVTHTGGAAAAVALNITPSAKVLTGLAFKMTTLSPNSTLVAYYGDGGTVQHAQVVINSTGAIGIQRASTVLATSASGLVTVGNWYYLEFSATIADSGGTVDVRLNGDTIHTFTGDTKNAGTSTNIDYVLIQLRASSAQLIDDVYILDGLGTINNAFLGEVRVQTLLPDGPGSATDLTPMGSADNWDNVDDVSPSDYNYSGTSGDQDLYALSELMGGTTDVLGVQVNAVARKTDTAARSLKTLVKSGATVTAGAEVALGAVADTIVTTYDVNPTTSAAWEVSDIAALEAGVEVV